VDRHGHDVSIVGGGLLTDDDKVTLADTRVLHAVAGDAKRKARTLCHPFLRDGQLTFHKLFGGHREPSHDSPDDGDARYGRAAITKLHVSMTARTRAGEVSLTRDSTQNIASRPGR